VVVGALKANMCNAVDWCPIAIAPQLSPLLLRPLLLVALVAMEMRDWELGQLGVPDHSQVAQSRGRYSQPSGLP
jgi:hypothetical protein